MTKSYTQLLAMILSDEGALDLEAAVSDFIPSMKRMLVQTDGATKASPARTTMLVRHLTTHTAGFSYQADFNFPPDATQYRYRHLVDAVFTGRISSLEKYVDELAKVPLCFEPGERYEYSHCIDVLGRVLEVASGSSLRDLLRERIFLPLGMHDTDFCVPRQKLQRLSGMYGNATTWGRLYGDRKDKVPVVSKSGLLRLDGSSPQQSAWSEGKVAVYSGGGFLGHNCGGLVSTTRDTEAFVQMLLSGGHCPDGSVLIRRKLLATLEVNKLTGPLKPKDGSCRWCILGDMIKHGDSLHYQMGGAAGTYWLVDRKRDLGIVFFTQQVDGEDWDKFGFKDAQADIDQVMRTIIDGRKK